MSEINITRRMGGKIQNLLSGEKHNVKVKTKYEVFMVEMEDVNFHHDSAVLLPDYGTSKPVEGASEEQDRITGLAVLYACYKHVRAHPQQSCLVVGHTDRSGSRAYNQTLSELRARSVLFALLGDRTRWVDISLQKNKVEDYQQILLWLTHQVGWNCDPKNKNNINDADTRKAVEDFQREYNTRFNASIDVDGKVGKQTWGAFFDVYLEELKHALGTDDEGLQQAQQSLKYLPCESIGCGEDYPKTPDRQEFYKSAIDRRVEILFFDSGEEPILDCAKTGGICKELYGLKMYVLQPVQVDPLPLPSGVAVRVMLQMLYKDPNPDAPKRTFPRGLPVTVEYADGSREEKSLGDDGILEFFALREKQSFTLRFTTPERLYVAVPPAEAQDPEELIAETQVGNYHRDRRFRLFNLPQDWGLTEADWSVRGTDTFDPSDHHFKQLDEMSTTAIGSEVSPVELVLDPHWQYVKLLYFDRVLNERLSIPPLMLEAFFRASNSSGAPDVRCNWTTTNEACQCIPWILRTSPRPDANVLFQFRTLPDTFIDSTGGNVGDRRLVTRNAHVVQDPGLNVGTSVAVDFNVPNAQRLAYYDLPQVWKSRTYFGRLSGGTGQPAAKSGRFEELAGEPTTDERPILFSLDDMVLTDSALRPINWTPSADIRNRLSVFCNSFAREGPSASDLSDVGMYKPDTGNHRAFFTQRPSEETDRNYIADYPEWTRLIITQGNAFDVFDQRTPDSPSGVVGARAAVRYVDVFTSTNTFVPPGTNRPSVPDPIERPFITVHPMYEQRHDRWWTSSQTDDRGIGRFDLILLRCCSALDSLSTEVGQLLAYFRFFFNFNATFESSATASGLSGNAATEWVNDAVGLLLRRWNGPEGTHNPTITELRAAETSRRKLHVRSLWFAQDLPRPISHYEMGVFQQVRAYMDASKGRGALRETHRALKTSGFGHGETFHGISTFAHEAGHGGSLGDEYVEQTSPTNLPVPWMPGFDSFSPGAPFSIDRPAMMVSNQQIRGRFSWHLAEWLWERNGLSIDFEVHHAGHEYRLPHHIESPRKSHVNFPIRAERNRVSGDHGRHDVFFYPLGAEVFSVDDLPRRARRDGAFTGIVVVVVKMGFDFSESNQTEIHKWLTAVHAQLDFRFNLKFVARGTVGGVQYDRVLLQVSPRYRASGYSATSPRDTTRHIRVRVPNSGVPEWDSGLFANRHRLHFPFNQPAHVFARFFAHMLGLADGTQGSPNSYRSLVRAVIPDAVVEAI
jgi:hypothetical protein